MKDFCFPLFFLLFYQKLIIFSKNWGVTEYCQRLWVVYHIFPSMHYSSLAWRLLSALLKILFSMPLTASWSGSSIFSRQIISAPSSLHCATLCQWYPVLCIPSQPGCATPSLTVLHEVMEKGNSFWEPPPAFPTASDCSTSGVQHFSHWALHHRSSRKSLLHQITQITAFPPPIQQARLQCTALCCKHRVGKCTSSMCPAGICWLLFVAESCDLFSTQPQISMVTVQANSCLPRGVTSFLKGKWLHICHCPSASQVPFRRLPILAKCLSVGKNH